MYHQRKRVIRCSTSRPSIVVAKRDAGVVEGSELMVGLP